MTHTHHTQQEILRVARRNRWTLCYLAVIVTALLIMSILEAQGRL
jgi:t-SNARE complex subunit (syntaxin)